MEILFVCLVSSLFKSSIYRIDTVPYILNSKYTNGMKYTMRIEEVKVDGRNIVK